MTAKNDSMFNGRRKRPLNSPREGLDPLEVKKRPRHAIVCGIPTSVSAWGMKLNATRGRDNQNKKRKVCELRVGCTFLGAGSSKGSVRVLGSAMPLVSFFEDGFSLRVRTSETNNKNKPRKLKKMARMVETGATVESEMHCNINSGKKR